MAVILVGRKRECKPGCSCGKGSPKKRDPKQDASQCVMDLVFALRKIGGTPTLRDLVKLAKRIKRSEHV